MTVHLCLHWLPPVSSLAQIMADNGKATVDNPEGKTKNKRRKSKAAKRDANSPLEKEGKGNKKPKTSTNEGQASKAITHEDIDQIDDAVVEIASRVGQCVTAQGEAMIALNDHSDQLIESKSEIKSLKGENKKLTKRLDNMDAALKAAMERIENVERVSAANQHMLKNSNIVLEGVAETPNENCIDKVTNILKEIESKCHKEDLVTAYRVGQKFDDAKFPRPIVAKLVDPLVKTIVMEGKGKLTNHELYSCVYLNDDLPPKLKQERKVLREIAKFAHKAGYKGCKASGSKLLIEGKAYRYETLHLLPKDLHLCNIRTRPVGGGIGFQGEESYLSNFFPVTLTVEQYSFSSGEQAYQFFKARTCKREDSASKILSLSDPKKIKETGDNVTTKAIWEQHKEAFMRSIVFAKFNQNEEIRKKLLDTGDLTLFECTRNRWWGSGLRIDAPEWESGTCPGLNKLGTILMEVRTALRKINYTEDALIKSPGAIIKSITKMDCEIQNRMKLPLLDTSEEVVPTVKDGGLNQNELNQNEVDMEIQDDESSTSDVEELMGETSIEEDSVNISSASTSSHSSNTTGRKARKVDLNVTDDKGKLDLSKIKSWSIPKLNRSYKKDNGEPVGGRTRGQQLRSSISTPESNPVPQAQSTPHPQRANRSMILDRVRAELNTSEKKGEGETSVK